jgi:acetolactate synthase-1/2/3 large subunit
MSVTNTVSGAQKIVEALTAQGVEKVFIYPGGTIAPILDVIERTTNIEIVCPRNEQGAGYAAIAYAKITGKPSVYMVTSGPGVTNAVTPIADAYYDNVPLIIFTGQVGTGDMRGSIPVKQRGFQEVDTVDIMRPITKAAYLVTETAKLPGILDEVFFLSASGRQGPIVIDLPMNVQRAELSETDFTPVVKQVHTIPRPKQETLETLASWIRESRRPVILAGAGVLASGAQDELRALADEYQIPVAMSMPGMGAYPSNGPLSLGLCGYAGSQYANLAIYKSDLLIGIGTTFHLRQTGSVPEKTAPGARIARIDLDLNELEHSRVPLNLTCNADAKEALSSLRIILSSKFPKEEEKTKEWLDTIEEWKKEFPLVIEKDKEKLKPQEVIRAVSDAVQDREVIVTTGVGQHQVWVPRHFSFSYPERQLLTSSGHGTMGFDLPAAIGAKMARPDSMVICFVGDGSFQMNIQELATIAEKKLDIKIIVLDNHALNIVAQFQRQNWKSDPSTGGKYNPDFARIAEAYGIPSASINSSSELTQKLAGLLTQNGPVLIHCDIDPKEDLLPMLMGGHTLDDMSFESSF